MALKRRRAEATKDAANEYAQLLAKRVNEEKAKKSELRSMSSSHPVPWLRVVMAMANLCHRATSELDEEVGDRGRDRVDVVWPVTAKEGRSGEEHGKFMVRLSEEDGEEHGIIRGEAVSGGIGRSKEKSMECTLVRPSVEEWAH